jgi:hypothetical protein
MASHQQDKKGNEVMRTNAFLLGAALLAACASPAFAASGAPGTKDPLPAVERIAAEIASDLARICPPAQPGDTAAFDRCRQGLFNDSPLKRNMHSIVIWGRVNPAASLKETHLTQFAPDVLTGMYIPLFMFNGRHTVELDAKEKLYVVRLETAFRNRLQPGQFPYPFWHSDHKWNTYQGANNLLLWIDPKSVTIRFAQFTDRGATPPINVSAPLKHEFDGKWMWTDAAGQAQPQVTLFDGLFSADNPYLHRLDGAYRKLALSLRDGQCSSCHEPDNRHGMKRLVLLQTPAHAAGEIKRLMKSVQRDSMPLDDAGIEAPLEAPVKEALLKNAGAFDALVDAAKEWERVQAARNEKAGKSTAAVR